MLEQRRSQSRKEPVKKLMAEHELISKVLNAFERWSEALLLNPKEDRLTLKRFLGFFGDFADGSHHIKEERVLFEVMTRHGFSDSEGPVAVMKWEHEEGRQLIRDLTLIASKPDPWTKEVCDDVNASATTYVTLLRNHIDKEDNILYPMAESSLPPNAWDEIATAFANIDEENECSGMWEENLALADQLLVY